MSKKKQRPRGKSTLSLKNRIKELELELRNERSKSTRYRRDMLVARDELEAKRVDGMNPAYKVKLRMLERFQSSFIAIMDMKLSPLKKVEKLFTIATESFRYLPDV